MRVLGIDPGYDRLGVAVVEQTKTGEKLIYSTCLTSQKKSDFAQRLLGLGNSLEKVIKKYQPDKLVLETLFFAKNRKTAMLVAETRGLILYLAAKHGLSVGELSPASVKLITTGYGRADKSQVINFLPKLIKIEERGRHDDEYDAIAIALAGLSTARG